MKDLTRSDCFWWKIKQLFVFNIFILIKKASDVVYQNIRK